MESKIIWKEPAKGEFPNEHEALIVLIKDEDDTEATLIFQVYYKNGEFTNDYICVVDSDETVMGWIYAYELIP